MIDMINIHNKLKNMIGNRRIEYCIDEVSAKCAQIEIRGWAAVRLADGSYDMPGLAVYDYDGREMESDIIRQYRPDVNMALCKSAHSDREFGFLVKFDEDEVSDRYRNPELRLIYESNTQRVAIDMLHAAEVWRRYRNTDDMVLMADRHQSADDDYYIRRYGRRFYERIVSDRLRADDVPYMAWRRYHLRSESELDIQRQCRLEYMPRVSILVPAYRTPREFLVQMLDSVVSQTYPNWELCIADASLDDSIVDILQEYHERDSRIVYRLLSENLGISDNTSAAYELATGDYIALLDHDDLLEPDCLYEVVKCINDESADIVYTDEDKVNMSLDYYFEPNFKPDYNRELLMSCNYITHFFVVAKSIVDRVGFLDRRFDGSQDYEFILRSTHKADKVAHVKRVVYHWRCHPNSTAMNPETKLYCYIAGERALQRTLDDGGLPGRAYRQDGYGCYGIEYPIIGNPEVLTIVINGSSYSSDINDRLVEKVVYISDVNDINVYDKLRECTGGVRSDFVHIVQGNGRTTGIHNMISNMQRENTGMVGSKVVSQDGFVVDAGRVVSVRPERQNVCMGLEADNRSYGMRLVLQQEVMALGLNGIMLRTVNLIEFLSDRERWVSLSAYMNDRDEKILYIPSALHLAEERLANVFDDYVDPVQPVREDRFYNENYSRSGKPYTFEWN